jgi:Spy/CpxP family protein refolding chaperone
VSPWKVILATMVIFTCGIFTGVFVTRTVPVSAAVSPTPQPQSASTNKTRLPAFAQLQLQRPEFLKKLDRQLDLTPDEHAEIEKIMSASRERTAPFWETIAPQMRDELARVRDEIRQVLTPEQRKKWAELNKHGRPPAFGNPRTDESIHPAELPGPATNTP